MHIWGYNEAISKSPGRSTVKKMQMLAFCQSLRSLIAAYLLVLNGYKNVVHLEGGLSTWFKEGLPSESEE
ncbi:hypothetical protein CRYUN_Cryun07bG0121600 [Craigia yunnanensis]